MSGRDLVPVGKGAGPQAPARRRGTLPAARRPATPPPRRATDRGTRDAEFLPSAIEIVESPPSPLSREVVVILCTLVATVFAWSYFGRLTEYATAAGKVQMAGRTKVLEPQAKGQVTKILVHDGDRVSANDVLIELDPTDAIASRAIVVQSLSQLRAESARRKAEIGEARKQGIATDPPVAWPPDAPQAIREREERVLRADLTNLAATLSSLATQRHEKEAERDKDVASIAAQKDLVAVTSENSSMADSLQKQGWNSKAKQLDLVASLREQQVALTTFEGNLADAQAAIATIDSEIAKAREGFVATDTEKLAGAEQQISELVQSLAKADEALANMTLRSPLAGTVHASAVTTVGQVVKPGQQLLQIVPDNLPIEIEAYVQNTDVGLIREGQDATIKVDAFNYSTYGSVPGTVVKVARDALQTGHKSSLQGASLDGDYAQSTAAQRTGTMLFPVTIRALRPTIDVDGKPVPLVAGMSVSVEVETENRRAIDYVASPLMELFSTAAHEK